jgi:hypothetical protein
VPFGLEQEPKNCEHQVEKEISHGVPPFPT